MEFLPLIIGLIVVVVRFISRSNVQQSQSGGKTTNHRSGGPHLTGDVWNDLRTAARNEPALEPLSFLFGEQELEDEQPVQNMPAADRSEYTPEYTSQYEQGFTPLDAQDYVAPMSSMSQSMESRLVPMDIRPSFEIAAYAERNRSRHNGSALHTGRTLSTAEGMAQAVVMAEVLQGRGGKGKSAWRR